MKSLSNTDAITLARCLRILSDITQGNHDTRVRNAVRQIGLLKNKHSWLNLPPKK